MKLRYLFYPVANAKETAGFYREVLGWEESWREQDLTIAMKVPDSEIGLLIDQDDVCSTPGGFFEVSSVDEFYREHYQNTNFIQEPMDIPPGRYAIFLDVAGNPVRIFDNSKDV